MVGSLTWMSAVGGQRLAPGVLHPNQDRKPPPRAEEGEEGGEGDMPADKMAIFGSMAIQQ
jgi:hypothetical protein